MRDIDNILSLRYYFSMKKLKYLRENSFLSQIDLAKKAGISATTVCRLEKGKEKPRFVTIRKLAEALGVEPGEIGF